MPTRALVIGGLVLGCIYGVFMGLYGATRPDTSSFLQLLATTLKVPLLFLLTLCVTFPSLYVFSALAGSRLKFEQTLRLLLAAVAINLALLASLGPVVGFFTLSTQSYPFMIVLNVIMLGFSGLWGLIFLRRALVHVFAPKEPDAPVTLDIAVDGSDIAPVEGPVKGQEGSSDDGSADVTVPLVGAPAIPILPGASPYARSLRRDRPEEPGLLVFRGWLVVYGVVGAQMGWVLRPFIGSPDLPFTWFREREGNFLQGLFDAIASLFS